MKKYIYQIYYDEETQEKILPEFIPLDNTKNLRPDWFEFWVILKFLRNSALEENAWYGFLSPKFYTKTGFNSDFVIKAIEKYEDVADVAIFSPAWDQLAYFLNPFEQGEVWHPGLNALSQEFINEYQLGIDLDTLVSDRSTAVMSNYVIAKKEAVEIYRLNVNFLRRSYGQSSWNSGFKSILKMSTRIILYSMNLRKKIDSN